MTCVDGVILAETPSEKPYAEKK